MPFPLLGAAIGGIGGLVTGLIQSDAQKRAAQAQADAMNRATESQEAMWRQQRADQMPYMQAGYRAIPNLERVAGEAANIDPRTDPGYWRRTSLTDPGNFNFATSGPNIDPSYNWRLNQGLNAVNNSAAARGGFFSGNTMAALNTRAQDEASQEFQNQFNRWNTMMGNYMNQEQFNADLYNQAWNRQMGQNQNQYNQWSGIAGMGQGAVNQAGTAGQNFANNTGNAWLNYGNAAANNAIGQGNIWGDVINNATNQFMSGWGQQQRMNQMENYSPDNDIWQNGQMINDMNLNWDQNWFGS